MKKTLITALILIGFIQLAGSLYGAIPASERAALIAIYNSTNGDNWINNSNWKGIDNEDDGFSKIGTEGSWYGITVGNDHVFWIDMYWNDLWGPLPPEIENLPRLVYLALEMNAINGSLPPELGNLKQLADINLNYNGLTGEIPTELCNMSSLAFLTLNGNSLSGSIPTEIGNLSNLQILVLAQNKLSGSIPTELENLSELIWLDLSANRLSGNIPEELGNLGNLHWLELDGNLLSGNIPCGLENAGSSSPWGITKLNIGYNALYTDCEELLSFLSIHDEDWYSTQTLAPVNVSAQALSSSEIQVSWTPIEYTAESGGYNVSCSTRSGGPWQFLGHIDDKSSSSTRFTRLSPGTTYYFSVAANTSSHYYNQKLIVSEYSHEVTATTLPVYYTLTVDSPEDDLPVTASPQDHNGKDGGLTAFTLTYAGGTTVRLTAPESHNGKLFSRWTLDGAEQTDRSIVFSMTGNRNVQVYYEYPTYTLSVDSSPDKSLPISVNPRDKNGEGDGLTAFSRTYVEDTVVYLTAAESHNGKAFSRWTLDGVELTDRSIVFTMTGNRNVQVYYEYPTYTLSVDSSPDKSLPISVNPRDKNGEGDGLTVFSRTYVEDTVVYLTAAESHNGKVFSRWTLDGVELTDRSIGFTMYKDRTVQVYYQSPVYTLTVQSAPEKGAGVTMEPAGTGDDAGSAVLTRTFTPGTPVTLTAAADYNGRVFSKWTIDGSQTESTRTINLTMDGDHSVVVLYEAMPSIAVSRATMNFAAEEGGAASSPQYFRVETGDDGMLNWSVSYDAGWLNCSPASGTGSRRVALAVDTGQLEAGTYSAVLTVSAPNVSNTACVTVNLEVYENGRTTEPFGEFSTPADNGTVDGCVSVSGWALDDVGVENVKIYREEGSGLAYLGDAVFVEGARPDLELAYPGYPSNHRAGWGYMMVTNCLPDGGNGAFILHALAKDNEGNTVTLGTKTIIVDNANAVKPFGTQDTPLPGGVVSGSTFINQGWLLTPTPNMIPVDGSTINVYLDGVNLGQPLYNLYRADIAEMFPGYANSEGAGVRITIDAAGLEEGLHQVYWTATDDAGNTVGIGSRYFMVNHTGTDENSQAKRSTGAAIPPMEDIPVDAAGEITATKGYGETAAGKTAAGRDGIFRLGLKEMQRVVLQLHGSQRESGAPALNSAIVKYRGYLMVGEQLRPLPIGSTLDKRHGVFYWQPGHGFIGTYDFVFIAEKENGDTLRKAVTIEITAKD
ncbi:MAG: hypothetical protein GY765_16245 [bacterium]|nr:hypothetical protein [bacterium]